MKTPALHPVCVGTREQFSAYLDGHLSGAAMAALANHLERCDNCRSEWQLWRGMQAALTGLRTPKAPANLQARLRGVLHEEGERGTHLRWTARWASAWKLSVAPLALRAAGGFALAAVLVGGLSWLFAAPLASVEANDDKLAHLTAPRYLYSEVPPAPIATGSAPLVVEAAIDDRGRVYDFHIVSGPADAKVLVRVEENLLNSVFRPASVFGTPVRGQVMLTYTGINVRG